MNYQVTFVVRESGDLITKNFDSLYRCQVFVNKLKHSKKLQLLTYPLSD